MKQSNSSSESLNVKTDTSIPVWDNSHIYSGFEDPKIALDCQQAEKLTAGILSLGNTLKTESDLSAISGILVEAVTAYEGIVEIIWSIATYAYSGSSVNAKDSNAGKLLVQSEELDSRLEQAFKPIELYLLRAPDEFLTDFFSIESVKSFEFYIRKERKLNAHLLSVDEEVTVEALAVDGLHAWGRLYDELTGSLKCSIAGEEMGLASAFNLTLQSDSGKRREAWESIQSAWRGREETAAAILNAINGWRHEENRLRSKKTDRHYLDVTCNDQAITRETLNAMMQATESRKTVGHRAVLAMAKGLGVEKLGPQDLLAPCPPISSVESNAEQSHYYAFDQAIDVVANAFSEFDPEMGQFAHTMYKNGWIDGRPSENRSTGAYCDQFENVREPRIFLTWDGSVSNVITLAHELGHAWHNWCMKDMSVMEAKYPSTLAETASIFAETLVRDSLFEQANTDSERMEIAWQDAEGASAFLLNIPSRFEFEKRMVEARGKGYLPASELSELMEESWKHWYEDSISEYDPMFWASKSHFSIAGMSFYNYPYLFGYLFSLGVYAQKEKLGDGFSAAYIALLRDTGTMTAEDLIMKHLGQDIRQPEFWHASLDIVERLVSRFEGLLQKHSI